MPVFTDELGVPFPHGDNFKRWLAPFIGQPVTAVEVGSWEGRPALWLMENILTNTQAVLHCIDNWEGEEAQQKAGVDFALKERNFMANAAEYWKKHRLMFWKGHSEDMLARLGTYQTFDFAYIDGSHQAPDLLMDTLLVWQMLKPGGVVIFDDYLWPGPSYPETHKPKLAIDAFLSVFQERLVILDKGYQVAVRKVA